MVICTGVFFNDEPEGEGIESSDAILWNNLKSGKVILISIYLWHRLIDWQNIAMTAKAKI